MSDKSLRQKINYLVKQVKCLSCKIANSIGGSADADWLRTDSQVSDNIFDSIYTEGFVGIGTNSPTQRLDINGTARLRSVPTGLQTDQVLTVDGSGNIRKITLPTGGSSTDKLAFKQNATGYFEIIISPFFQGTIIMTVKLLKHNQGVEEYTITGYTNSNTWLAPRVTKTSQTANEETVRFVNNGLGDFRIYIGEGTEGRGLHNIFITEVLRAGIMTTNPYVQDDISSFTINVTPTITGTVQSTV